MSTFDLLEYINKGTLDWLVQGVADSHGFEDSHLAEATPHVALMFSCFEKACESLLEVLLQIDDIHPKERTTSSVLMEADAPYLIFMTLNGEGVGIWDGRWDHFFKEDTGSLGVLEDKIKEILFIWADDTGCGVLNEALESAAYETTGQNDPE